MISVHFYIKTCVLDRKLHCLTGALTPQLSDVELIHDESVRLAARTSKVSEIFNVMVFRFPGVSNATASFFACVALFHFADNETCPCQILLLDVTLRGKQCTRLHKR